MPSHCPLALNCCSKMRFFSGQRAISVGMFPLGFEAKSLIFCRFLPVSVGSQWAVSGQREGKFTIMIPTHLLSLEPAQYCPSLHVFGAWPIRLCHWAGTCLPPRDNPGACVAAKAGHKHHHS